MGFVPTHLRGYSRFKTRRIGGASAVEGRWGRSFYKPLPAENFLPVPAERIDSPCFSPARAVVFGGAAKFKSQSSETTPLCSERPQGVEFLKVLPNTSA